MANSAKSLAAVTRELAQTGYDTTELRELRIEIETLERPPGFIRRITVRVKQSAAHHWSLLVGELGESREAFGLVREALKGRPLNDAERDAVRSQLVDLVKVFPAGLIAAANTALPIPGTGLLTPWILLKLGLLPSRWREAHILNQLQKQHQKLIQDGNLEAAQRIREIELQIEEHADRREAIAKDAQLLTHWDKNQNGVWDESERQAYLAEVERLRSVLSTLALKRAWFFSYEGEVFGPIRLNEISKHGRQGESLLCCYDGRSGWVALSDLLSAVAAAPRG